MDLEDKVPVLILHFLERNIPKNTSIIEKDVDPSESIDRSLDDLFTELD